MATRELSVPFSEEELASLETLATHAGGSVQDLVRLRVFGPQEDPIAQLARREGERIRNEDALALYDRVLRAMLAVRGMARSAA